MILRYIYISLIDNDIRLVWRHSVCWKRCNEKVENSSCCLIALSFECCTGPELWSPCWLKSAV